MREKFNAWLGGAAAMPAVVAAAVRLSERACLSRSANDLYPLDRFSLACQLVAEAVALLNSRPGPPLHLVLRFQEGELHFALRPDGIALGLLTKLNASESPTIQKLITEFQELA